MISNERRSPYRPASGPQAVPQNPEEAVKTAQVQIERKSFVITLRENPRGRFLRITEEVNGRRDSVIVPSTGLTEFSAVLLQMVKASQKSGNSQVPLQ